MLNFHVLTPFAEEFENLLNFGLIGTAKRKNLFSLSVYNLRNYGVGNHHAIDDRPFGGDDGMVITAPVLEKALENIKSQIPSFISDFNSTSPGSLSFNSTFEPKPYAESKSAYPFDCASGAYPYPGTAPNQESDSNLKAPISEQSPLPTHLTLYLSPQGQPFTQTLSEKWLKSYQSFTLICGRYSGVDQRFLNHYAIEEVSIGDYILSGGELPAAIIIDTLVRQTKGVLGNDKSAQEDSFSQSPYLLEPPLFTRPQVWHNQKVPEVLLSGHHENLKIWKKHISLLVTYKKRPDLFMKLNLSSSEMDKLIHFYNELTEEEKLSLGFNNLNLKTNNKGK